MDIAATTMIDAPVAQIWERTLDIDQLPSITPTVTTVERIDPGPVRPGTRARLKQPGMPGRVWTVEEVDAPRRFVWTSRLAGVRIVAIHDLEAVTGDSCRLTLRIRFEGRGSRLLTRLGRRSISAALDTEAAGFARAAA